MKLSVITVCYQAVDQLEKTIQSVRQQTNVDLEYVIIDGGSTDGTMELVDSYGEDIQIAISEKDQGIYDAMNKGTRLCHGDYILFLNAGDVLAKPDTLQKAAAVLESEKPDILYGDYYEQDHGKQTYVSYQGIKINSWYFLMSKMICHQAIIARKKLLQEHPFDLTYRYAADRKWLMQCQKQGAVMRHIPVAISVYDRTGVSSEPENFEKVRGEVDRCVMEAYPVRGRMLQLIKSNKGLREKIRKMIFKRNR